MCLKNNFDADSNCLVIYRNIENLDENLSKEKAAFFTDVLLPSRQVDADARAMLTQLKETRIPAALKRSTAHQLDVEWRDFHKNPSDNEEYLRRFCELFEFQMKKLIAESARKASRLNTDPYVVEVLQHMKMCKSR